MGSLNGLLTTYYINIIILVNSKAYISDTPLELFEKLVLKIPHTGDTEFLGVCGY